MLELSCHDSHPSLVLSLFFFNDPAPTEIYTLSLHDALPISDAPVAINASAAETPADWRNLRSSENYVGYERTERFVSPGGRSEEHTSELQSRRDLVCRLLLEKKKKKKKLYKYRKVRSMYRLS